MATLKSEVEDLKQQLVELADRLDSVSHKTGDIFNDEMREYFDSAKERVQERLNTAKRMARERGDQVDTYAKENPWQVAGIAAAIGFAVAALLSKDRQ